MDSRRLIILGAGPIGLEAALYAAASGFRPRVLERGRLAENVLQWGHVRLFTPWSYNCSPLGRRRLAGLGQPPPDADAICPTGREWVERYAAPLARLPELAGVVEEGAEVIACGRGTIGKRDLPGAPRRAEHPFRLLIRGRKGEERFEEADIVIDATGVYGCHNWVGEGGIPAAGERALEREICYGLPDPLGRDRADYAGRATLVVGAGMSAATTVTALAELKADDPRTRIFWACRREARPPIAPLADDPLPERRRLVEAANRLADGPGVDLLPGRHVVGLERENAGFRVELRHGDRPEALRVDRIVANVGYHPEAGVYRQLHVHECYATLGPMALAAALLGQKADNCLAVRPTGPETLRNPEPDFYILGAKSFGLNSSFLLRLGHDQIVQIFRLITGRPDLNLYVP